MALRAFTTFVLLLAWSLGAHARDVGVSGLPLPRFVSLAADEVNLRTGPGFRFPIAWVFVREAMPVEVIGEFEDWRRVRDHDGAEGWVHKALLSGERTVLVTGAERTLHREPRDDSPLVARAEAGVQGHLRTCRDEWCEIVVTDIRGWVPRGHLWGVYGNEIDD
jgi:SH3-like domain-containing protein